MASENGKHPGLIRLGDEYEIDRDSFELRRAGRLLKLERIPMRLLLLLVEKQGRVVTRGEIVESIWGKDAFLDADNSLNGAIRKIRYALKDNPEKPRFVQTIPGRGYRLVAAASPLNNESESEAVIEGISSASTSVLEQPPASSARVPSIWIWRNLFLLCGCTLLVTMPWLVVHNLRSGRTAAQAASLRERDTVMIAAFANQTSDPVFDGTLRQALAMELEQSPFLNVASDIQVSEILERMGRGSSGEMTQDIAREACVRMGAKAMFSGTITRIGDHYLIGLEALGCENAAILATEQAEVQSKQNVLRTLGELSSHLRSSVGESLPSLQKFSFPVNATTTSLEALKTFSLGQKAEHGTSPLDAIPFYERAIQLDPKFALSYAALGRVYADFGEDEKARRYFELAYRLRDLLGEREKYFVEIFYFETVTGELPKAVDIGRLWTTTYPKDPNAREKLGTVFGDLGDTKSAHEQMLEAYRLDPLSTINVFNVVTAELANGEIDNAERTLRAAKSGGTDGEGVRTVSYLIAFMRRDFSAMQEHVSWAMGRPDVEQLYLQLDSESKAFFGHMKEARDLSERATRSAKRDHLAEIAADCQIESAFREIESGNPNLSLKHIRAALALSATRLVKAQAALGFARAGDSARARILAGELRRVAPQDTLIQSYWIPAIEASLENRARKPSDALTTLQATAPYEYSATTETVMYPIYIRGEAYLMNNQPDAAAKEFEKIVLHPGLVQNGFLGVLARLQLARAELKTGDPAVARNWYRDFLTLWKNADADTPVLKQAQSEFAQFR